MSKRYDTNQPVAAVLQIELDNTKSRFSQKIGDEDAEILGDLQEKYGDAALVELLAGFHLGSVIVSQRTGGFVRPILDNSEQLGVTLYAAAQAVAGLAGEDKTGSTHVLDTNQFVPEARPSTSLAKAEKDLDAALDALNSVLDVLVFESLKTPGSVN